VNAQIYREGAGAGGLPLPRKSLSALTIIVALLAFIALVLSPMLLAFAAGNHGVAGVWRLVKEGGLVWMGPVLLLDLAVPITLAVLGAFVMRGKKVPPFLLLVGSALPFAIGLLGAFVGQRTVFDAISGESVDPEQKIRIMAEGAAETMANDILAGFVTCGCAIVACAAAAAAAASIDVAMASRGAKSGRAGLFGAGAVGGAWLLASIVLAAIRIRHVGPLVAFPVLIVATIVPFAIMAGRSASLLRGWHDRTEASRMLAATAVAGLCATLAVLAFERAALASVTARALHAIAGESVDPSQQARILFEAVQGRRFSTLACIAHGVLGLATFAAALAPGIGGGPQGARHPLTPSVGIAAVVAVALLCGTLGLSCSRSRAAKVVAAAGDAVAPAGVALPTVRGTFSHRGEGPRYGGGRIVIGPGGAELEKGEEVTLHGGCASSSSSAGGAGSGFAVYGDRSVTSTQLVEVLKARGCETPSLVFVARRDHDPAIDAQLGEMAAYLGSVAYVQATVAIDPPGRGEDVLLVRSVAGDAIEVDGKRVAIPMPPGASFDHHAGRVQAVRYAFQPTDTIERMLRIVVDVREAFGGRLETSTTVIDIGMPPRPPRDTSGDLGGLGGIALGNFGGRGKPPSLRQGATQVNGRLPPEVIQRIVRQQFGRFRLCYENGLRTDPKLTGRVAVKFVIDRSGSVTSAQDGGSDLPNAGVVSCVVRAFGNLSFPQPEGGIVTVVYPLVFSPGE
jgi:hypothetical protein